MRKALQLASPRILNLASRKCYTYRVDRPIDQSRTWGRAIDRLGKTEGHQETLTYILLLLVPAWNETAPMGKESAFTWRHGRKSSPFALMHL
jgi:hypothetical protein